MIKNIFLKPEVTEEQFTKYCNKCEKDGVFVASGTFGERKWIKVSFKNDIDFSAWIISLAT